MCVCVCVCVCACVCECECLADPVACIAVLKELGVLPDLRILIEAESVLNDGAGLH